MPVETRVAKAGWQKIGGSMLAVLALLLAWAKSRFPKDVKYAKGLPFIGLLHPIIRGAVKRTLHDDQTARHKELGQTFAVNLMGAPIVFTTDPKNIEHALKLNFDNYIKGAVFRDPFTDLLGDGIFNVDGELWHKQRKISSKMFTKKQFETQIWTSVKANAQKVHNVLKESSGKEICMFSLMNRFTLDTIGQIGFSRTIGSIEDPSSPFLASFDYVQAALVLRLYTSQTFPTWKVCRFFGVLWEKGLPAHLDLLNEYAYGIVDDLLEKVAVGDDSSFVGLFAKDSSGEEMRKHDEKGFRTFMRDMVLNFLIAGRDTTAQCLTWTIYRLAQSPEVVTKIREEVERVCGNAELGYQHVANLKYVKACLDEGLRLHPSVPTDVKVAIGKDVLPDGTTIPPGTRFSYNPYCQGRCEEIWGSDACTFRPERWFEMEKRPTPYEFVAFNAGPRECLGRRLAEMEMTTFVAGFVRDFDFALATDAQNIKYDSQLTLGCSTGLPMTVSARS